MKGIGTLIGLTAVVLVIASLSASRKKTPGVTQPGYEGAGEWPGPSTSASLPALPQPRATDILMLSPDGIYQEWIAAGSVGTYSLAGWMLI